MPNCNCTCARQEPPIFKSRLDSVLPIKGSAVCKDVLRAFESLIATEEMCSRVDELYFDDRHLRRIGVSVSFVGGRVEYIVEGLPVDGMLIAEDTFYVPKSSLKVVGRHATVKRTSSHAYVIKISTIFTDLVARRLQG